jgi:hypothetical protein
MNNETNGVSAVVERQGRSELANPTAVIRPVNLRGIRHQVVSFYDGILRLIGNLGATVAKHRSLQWVFFGSEGTAPGCPPGVRTYSYQNQDALRSGGRSAAPRPAQNSVRAASAISRPPTPPARNDWQRKLAYPFSSNAVSLDGDPVC